MDIQLHHSQNHAKLEVCFEQLSRMDIVAKSQMFKFYRNISKKWAEMDKEFVTCRRSSKLTAIYQKLETEFYESITVFEQWSIMAALMYV